MGALRFEGFTLDPPRSSLMRGTQEIPLRPQCLKVLAYLVGRPGQVVTNGELIESCWENPKQTSINSLAQCIKEIREALGKTQHEIVRTVPRKGYLFAAPVSVVEEAARAGLEMGAPDGQRFAAAIAGRWPPLPQRWKVAVAAIVLVSVLVGGTWAFWSSAGREPELTMMAVPSLVVLPIKPPLGEADVALATLGDEIAAGIWRAPRGFIPDIRPPSAAKDESEEPTAAGRRLGVRYVVRALARRDKENILVAVQLIETQTGRQVWVGDVAYGSDERDAQSRAAARIGQMLADEILRVEARRPLPVNMQAGHFVMLGRPLMTDGRDAASNAKAIAYFEKALGVDPQHVLALVHYARATAIHRLSGWMDENEVEQRIAKAEAAIDLAIRRAPSAGGYVTQGGVLRAKGEHGLAIAAFEHALELDPSFFPARAELGRSLIDVGEAEKAIALFKQALEANPPGIPRFMWYYWMGLAALHLPGRHEEALMWLNKSLGENRHHDLTYRLVAVALDDAGRRDEARKAIEKALNLRQSATLDDWKTPNLRSHPEVAKVREHIRATLKRLGVPEGRARAASSG
jgi:DNA-binding winged helix-turn-helix (wHTH) protein/tetratricopeptide (TPR) repeat protein